MTFYKVCPSKDISTQKAFKFTIQNQDILVAKSNNNSYWAFDIFCTHAEKSLEKGTWNAQTAEITCPFHKAVFNVEQQGAVKAAPAFVSLPVYNTKLIYENGEEFIFVELD